MGGAAVITVAAVVVVVTVEVEGGHAVAVGAAAVGKADGVLGGMVVVQHYLHASRHCCVSCYGRSSGVSRR